MTPWPNVPLLAQATLMAVRISSFGPQEIPSAMPNTLPIPRRTTTTAGRALTATVTTSTGFYRTLQRRVQRRIQPTQSSSYTRAASAFPPTSGSYPARLLPWKNVLRRAQATTMAACISSTAPTTPSAMPNTLPIPRRTTTTAQRASVETRFGTTTGSSTLASPIRCRRADRPP